MGRKHEWRAIRYLADVVDEHDAKAAKAVDHEPVVNDLVVAVDGRVEHAHHPTKRFDRHLDTGTEAARFGEQDAFHARGWHIGEGTALLPVS